MDRGFLVRYEWYEPQKTIFSAPPLNFCKKGDILWTPTIKKRKWNGTRTNESLYFERQKLIQRGEKTDFGGSLPYLNASGVRLKKGDS